MEPLHIFILGGGTGGTILANILARKLNGKISQKKIIITLLTDNPMHYYKPAFMYVAFNLFFKEELSRPQCSLLRPEINLVIDKACSFDFKNKKILSESKKIYNYDYLILLQDVFLGQIKLKVFRIREIIFILIKQQEN